MMVQYQDVHLCKELHQNSQQILEIRCRIYSDYHEKWFPSKGMYQRERKANNKNTVPGIVEEIILHINFSQ